MNGYALIDAVVFIAAIVFLTALGATDLHVAQATSLGGLSEVGVVSRLRGSNDLLDRAGVRCQSGAEPSAAIVQWDSKQKCAEPALRFLPHLDNCSLTSAANGCYLAEDLKLHPCAGHANCRS